MRCCLGLVVLAAVSWSRPAAGQSVRLRFDPADGAILHRVFQVYTQVTIRDTAVLRRDVAELGSLREAAVRGPSGEPVVHLSYDSVQVRVREAPGAWRVAPGPDNEGWVQVHFDDQLRVQGVTTSGASPDFTRLVGLVTGLPRLELPARAVRRGDAWTSTVEVRVGDVGGADGKRLVGEARVTVDSVVGRSRDTLAYLSLAAALKPADPDASTPVAYGGGVTGSLVWSTGWNAFVAAATRTRVEAQYVRGAAGARRRGSLLMETTIRQQVRSGP